MTDSIGPKRQEIDAIDKQLVELLEKRAKLAADLFVEKDRLGHPLYDPQRELAVLNRVKKHAGGVFPERALSSIFSEIMSVCRNLRASPPIGLLGEKFGWVHDAALERFGSAATLCSLETGEELLGALNSGDIDMVFFPMRGGSDLPLLLESLLGNPLTIVGETLYLQRFALFSADVRELSDVTEVFVTRESMTMVRQWILSLSVPVRITICRSMVEVVENLVAGRQAAGVVPEHVAKTLEGCSIRDGLEAFAAAPIRCLTAARRSLPFHPRNKASVLCHLSDDPETMPALLAPLAAAGCSLLGIEMFRFHQKAWKDLYFIDFETPDTDVEYDRILAAMAEKCRLFQSLGQYPVTA